MRILSRGCEIITVPLTVLVAVIILGTNTYINAFRNSTDSKHAAFIVHILPLDREAAFPKLTRVGANGMFKVMK